MDQTTRAASAATVLARIMTMVAVQTADFAITSPRWAVSSKILKPILYGRGDSPAYIANRGDNACRIAKDQGITSVTNLSVRQTRADTVTVV